jgi:hypothetical protein
MRPCLITDEEARAMLASLCEGRGEISKLAAKTGVFASHISNMLAGRRRINVPIAAVLGLKPVAGFINAEPAPHAPAVADDYLAEDIGYLTELLRKATSREPGSVALLSNYLNTIIAALDIAAEALAAPEYDVDTERELAET